MSMVTEILDEFMKSDMYNRVFRLLKKGKVSNAASEMIECISIEEVIKKLEVIKIRGEINYKQFMDGLKSLEDFNVENTKLIVELTSILSEFNPNKRYRGELMMKKAISIKSEIERKRELKFFRESREAGELVNKELSYILAKISEGVKELREKANLQIGIPSGNTEPNTRIVNWTSGSIQIFISSDSYFSLDNFKLHIGLLDGPLIISGVPSSRMKRDKLLHEIFEIDFFDKNEVIYHNAEVKMKKDGVVEYFFEILLKNYDEKG